MLCKIVASLCCAFTLQGLQTFAVGFKFRDQHTDSNMYKQDCRQLEVIVPCACDWMFYHLVRAIQSSDSTDCVFTHILFSDTIVFRGERGRVILWRGQQKMWRKPRGSEPRSGEYAKLQNYRNVFSKKCSFLKTLSAKLYCIWCLVSNCQNTCNNRHKFLHVHC